jgi:hypothetical protein
MRCVPQNSSFSATRGHSMCGDCRRFPFLADLLRVDCRSGCRSRGHTGGRTWSCAWLMLTSMGRRGTSGGAVCRERDRCGDGRLRPSGSQSASGRQVLTLPGSSRPSRAGIAPRCRLPVWDGHSCPSPLTLTMPSISREPGQLSTMNFAITTTRLPHVAIFDTWAPQTTTPRTLQS